MNTRLRLVVSISVVISLGSNLLAGQVEEAWVARYDEAGDGGASSTALDVDEIGNVYVTGTSVRGFVTVKYNAEGRELWVAHYEGSAEGSDNATAIMVDERGAVYVTGGTGGEFREVPLAPCSLQNGCDETSTQIVSHGIATVKYDQRGQELWVAQHGAEQWYAVVGLAGDQAGNVYVTATAFADCTGLACVGGDFFVIKYNSNGQEIWRSLYDGGGEDQLAAIAVDSVGDVLVTGSSVSGAAADYFTVKYDSEGNEIWSRRHDGGAHDRAAALAVDASGNVCVTGGASVSGDPADSVYLTVQYDPDGQELWARRFDGAHDGDEWDKLDWPVAIANDDEGNVAVTGGVAWGCDLICAPRQYATLKYSPEGEEMWVARHGDMATYHHLDEVSAVDLDAEGNVYVVGTVLPWGERHHIVTLKYGLDGEEVWSVYQPGSIPGEGAWGQELLALGEDGSVLVSGILRTGILSGGEFWTVKYIQNSVISATFLRGDCNDDGGVDISDSVCILGWLFLGEGKPGCVAVTDTNGDAGGDLSDAVYLLSHLFLGGPPPVAPFPECGPMPDADELGCDVPPASCQ